jgi:NADPH:quinone reductase-like Zn-dependent oxidoreductase
MTSDRLMRAVTREVYGGPEVIRVEEVPRPAPADGEILVRVHVASVNRADLDALTARYAFAPAFTGLRKPRMRGLGIDAAGVVEAVGAGVTRMKSGDRVYADLFAFNVGAFADYVVAPERAWAPIPPSMSSEVAATLPHSGILAVQGLRWRDRRTPGPGDRVLVDGASGNVGPFAVQLAKALGAEVTGTSRTDKMDLVRSLGADHVIDYTATDDTTRRARYDWILDVDSHLTLGRARRRLRPGGTYVTLGGPASRIFPAMLAGPVISKATGHPMGLMLWWKPFDRNDLATLERHVAAGTVRPVIDREFPLDQAAAALAHVADGNARGKVLIRP